MHRRDSLRAEKILQDKLFEKSRSGNIQIIWNSTLDEVLGDEHKVTGAVIRNLQNNAKEQLNVDGVFIAIGHTPNT